MVQFAADTDTKTTGTGRFLLTARPDSVIDPPPHDRAYFEQHMTFLANYFRKVSRGKLLIAGTVVDSVYTLSAKMEAYSPRPGGSDSVLANLARDTWQLVEASGKVPDFSRYQCYVVFHAGAGRDVDLVSLYQADPTPYDIPSITLGPRAFKEAYGPAYPGIPVQGGAFHITNTAILPETESRELPTVTGSVYLELGINGLLCASIGSYLGLPDLFDTKTGSSGIGRFGLMDGQGIFSFSGVFPPEPSAWEKIALGWVTPVDVAPGSSVLRVPARTTPDTVYRVRFSPTEYYLVENRNRDAQRNGQTVTSILNGVVRTQFFRRDTTGFDAYDISALSGVVTDVEDLDWSLPGGKGENDEWFDGGVLIWHIDEAVIAAGMADNTVNADPERRGVDVEEADGSQDIGQSYEGVFAAGAGSEAGTALDFWFKGSASPVNTNTFSASTYPDTRSNNGSKSHVSIKEFSDRAPVMSATVVVGDAEASLLGGFPRTAGSGRSEVLQPLVLDQATLPTVLVTTAAFTSPAAPGLVYAFPTDGAPALPLFRSDGAVASTTVPGVEVSGRPALRDLNGDSSPDLIFAYPESNGAAGIVQAVSLKSTGPDSLGVPLFTLRCSSVPSTPVVSDSLIALPGASGVVTFARFNGTVVDTLPAAVSGMRAWVGRFNGANVFAVANGSVLRIVDGTTTRVPAGSPRSRDFGAFIEGAPLAGLFRANGVERPGLVFTLFGGALYLVDEDLQPFPGYPVSLGVQTPCSALALGDIDGDGSRDIVVFRNGEVLVLNSSGAMLDNFPVKVAEMTEIPGASSAYPGASLFIGGITSSPVIGDVDADGKPEILGGTADGRVFAVTRKGTMAGGFPLPGGTYSNRIALFDAGPAPQGQRVLGIAAGTVSGEVIAWKTGSTSITAPWPQTGRDGTNSNAEFGTLSSSPVSGDYFPKERAYNWPNPTYDGKTYIRYYVSESAAVRIRILDLAGDLVTELNANAVGGVDNEILWNASGVQSGVYYAHIHAQGSTGSGDAVIKIAVVR
jgi:hypothetical protein